ncbi:putative endopeptidase [Leifsonia sp. 98AMF]|uniref:M13 family metallopeptidase n=1 Tax=unclassified Leifsonia TaxID=2663824 RepID=UPI0008794388|nr:MULTISPECIES: M13-type metalloendopeptidase [unclassified Leifsonia]SDH01157.1 putative endopeptidase [Leifsonia sp. 197AMF]SDJ40267.1 putative endopeptidase [Leifsonia sp. 466MF]SDK37668.1 putative endopeptidase [Leifsonia sp. 157MF]SDN60512.1 putative endopeptidase [Leifsonia sp. 509MF]SEN48646.1 putative endopeptidase [Leifsonia sp. 467MF]
MTLDSGIRTDELDPAVRPQDDLFRHVNGKWLEATEIPADKARWGSFMILAEESETAVHEIVEKAQNAPEGTEERKFGDLYTSFMDEERIDALGVEAIRDELTFAEGVDSIPSLLQTIAKLERRGLGGFYQLFVDNDPGDPGRYLVFLEQAGISLPDESYFREERFAPVREAFVAHIQKMFELAGYDDAPERAQRVFDLETAIAGKHWDNVASRDSEKTYNLYDWADAKAVFTGGAADGQAADLDVWAEALDAPQGALAEVVLRQPSFTAGLAELLTDDRLESWRDWLTWQVIHGAAPYLSGDFVEANFDFYGRTLTGTPQMRVRWKRGVSLVEGAMGEAVGRIYVEHHFPPAAKQQMDELVANLIEAYRQSIRTLDWMGEETKERALDKLEKFTPKIGYPVKWRDYARLEIDPTNLVGNVRAAALFEFERELGKIGSPIDRDEWFMTPQTINAYYNPGFNEIVFPAAILQFPFFDADRDAAANYGAIGAVIGHEIGHGFDDQGSKFDGDGRLEDWWTEADRAAFEERTASLIEQYNALAPAQVPEHHVNGALTIGENIGDLGGLGIAWKAYLLSLNGEEPPVIDGLTGAERFFLSWAQAWQQKGRDEEVIRLLAIDPHAPNEFRCNQIVRNIDAFYDTFQVGDGDRLWLPPAERVTIW